MKNASLIRSSRLILHTDVNQSQRRRYPKEGTCGERRQHAHRQNLTQPSQRHHKKNHYNSRFRENRKEVKMNPPRRCFLLLLACFTATCDGFAIRNPKIHSVAADTRRLSNALHASTAAGAQGVESALFQSTTKSFHPVKSATTKVGTTWASSLVIVSGTTHSHLFHFEYFYRLG